MDNPVSPDAQSSDDTSMEDAPSPNEYTQPSSTNMSVPVSPNQQGESSFTAANNPSPPTQAGQSSLKNINDPASPTQSPQFGSSTANVNLSHPQPRPPIPTSQAEILGSANYTHAPPLYSPPTYSGPPLATNISLSQLTLNPIKPANARAAYPHLPTLDPVNLPNHPEPLLHEGTLPPASLPNLQLPRPRELPLPPLLPPLQARPPAAPPPPPPPQLPSRPPPAQPPPPPSAPPPANVMEKWAATYYADISGQLRRQGLLCPLKGPTLDPHSTAGRWIWGELINRARKWAKVRDSITVLVKVPERLEGDGGWGRWELVWDVTLAISGSNRPFHEEVEIPNSRLWTILDSMVGGYGVGRGEVVVVRTGW